MNKLQLVSMKRHSLPEWKAPQTTKQAANIIAELSQTMHEYAYVVGKTLLWVKTQERKNFLSWLDANVKLFGQRSAYHMMRFAKWCDEQQELLEYHGHRTKFAPGTNFPEKNPSKGTNGDRIGHKQADRLRQILEPLNQKHRNRVIFWIKAVLEEYEGEASDNESNN